MPRKAYGDMNLDDVRALVREVRAEGLKIQSHYKRLEQEYSDWEDRINELDKIISRAEDDTGLTKKEIEKDEYALPDDLINFGDNEDSLTGKDYDALI